MARVVYRDENFQTFYVDVNDQQPEVTIGRNTGNMVVIPAKSLSRYHAKIVYQNSHYFLIDLKSSNGSYVNNQRVTQQEIHPGDKLRFGEVCVEFVDDGRGSLAPAGAGLVNMNMPPSAPMPPQRPMAAPPQMPPAMSSAPPVPNGVPGMPRPASPAAPKLGAPKLQMFNPNLSNSSVGPDLRSVSMRPISSGGTYRPTMPNQPTFDEDMAKVAMEQMAAQSAEQSASPVASTMTNGLSPEAAPRVFNPNSMGLRPPVNQRSMVAPPSRAPMPAAPDPVADAPSTFNPGSMGIPRQQPDRVRMSDLASPVGMNGVANAAAAPLSFNPNGMGPAGMPVAPTPMQTTARPAFNNGVVVVNTQPSAPSDMMPGFGLPAQVAPVSMPSGPAFDPVIPEPPIADPLAAQPVAPQPDNRDLACNEPEPVPNPEANVENAEIADNPEKDDSFSKMEPVLPASERRASVGHRDRMSSDGFSSLSGNARRAARPGLVGRGESSSSQQSSSSSSQVSSVPVATAPVASGYNRAVGGRGMPSGRARFAHRQDVADASASSSGSTPTVQRGSSAAIPAVEKISADEQAVNVEEKVSSDIPKVDEPVAADVAPNEVVQNNVDNNSVPMETEAPKSSDNASFEEEQNVPVEDDIVANDSNGLDTDFQSMSGKSEIIELPDADAFEDLDEDDDDLRVPSVSSAELDKLRDELAEVREQLSESQQTVEILNGAMAELKEHHASEMNKLKAEHQKNIEDLKEAHLTELAEQRDEIEASYEKANIEMNSLQIENECIASELAQLKKQLDDINEAGDQALKFIPKWSSRFDALVQYAKAMERAVDKLKLDVVEPKTFEYVRSMSDMIRFCADDLKKLDK